MRSLVNGIRLARRALVCALALGAAAITIPTPGVAATVVWSSRNVKKAAVDSSAVRDSLARLEAARAAARAAAVKDSVARAEAARIASEREVAAKQAAERASFVRDSLARSEAASVEAVRRAAEREADAKREAARAAARADSLAKAAKAAKAEARRTSAASPARRSRTVAMAATTGNPAPVVVAAASVPAETPAAAPAEPRGARSSSRLTYLAGRSAYVDAGELEGLAVGDTVTIVRDGQSIGLLRVAFVSSHRASCDTLWTRVPLAVGDAARFRSDPRRRAAAADSVKMAAVRSDSLRAVAVLPAPKSRAATRNARTRGRAGARWLSVRTDGAGQYQQPGIELRVDSRGAAGGHMDASLDIRGRRTTRTSEAGTQVDQLSRVYRASTTIRDAQDRRRMTLGRQTSPTLASVSLFDGALLEWASPTHTFGAFSGTQPDPIRFSWSHELIEGGVFAEWHQRPLAETRWSVATGAITSRQGAEVNRDFMFAQGWWFSKLGSASVAQEVDLNTGWKRTAGEPLVSWTSTFATVRLPIRHGLAVTSGYDNRRSVRLWRDRETPETDFDDRYRQGAWGGATLDVLEHVHAGAEYRAGSGGDRSRTRTVQLEVRRLTRWQASLRTRSSTFDAPESGSTLWSMGTGFDPWPQSHVEYTFGRRNTTERITNTTDSERWQGIDVDLALGGRWYLNGGYERQMGFAGTTRQLQAGVSVRL